MNQRGFLVTVGINEEDRREIIGFNLANSETEDSWGTFFNSLKERGLKDVGLVTFDNHKGLVKAVRKHFQGVSWQRCQTHFSRKVIDNTPKSLQPEIKEDLRNLYDAIDIENARKYRELIFTKYEVKAPKAVAVLDD